jgi:hypothetical protein
VQARVCSGTDADTDTGTGTGTDGHDRFTMVDIPEVVRAKGDMMLAVADHPAG